MPRHYLNECWFLVNRTLGDNLQWNSDHNTKLFIHKNALENIVCEMAAILSRGRCVIIEKFLDDTKQDLEALRDFLIRHLSDYLKRAFLVVEKLGNSQWNGPELITFPLREQVGPGQSPGVTVATIREALRIWLARTICHYSEIKCRHSGDIFVTGWTHEVAIMSTSRTQQLTKMSSKLYFRFND